MFSDGTAPVEAFRGGERSSVSAGAAPRLLFVATVAVTLRSFLLPYARYFRALGWRVDGAAAGVSRCPSCAAAFDAVHDLSFSRNPLAASSLATAAKRLRLLAGDGRNDLCTSTPPWRPSSRALPAGSLRRRGLRMIYTAHVFIL